jgi:myo-inositol-1(or 4)-monophosphatase
MIRYEKELAVAQAAALAAGEIARASYAKIKESDVGEKGANDLVTHVDIASQRAVVGRLREAFPGDFIVAEEELAPEVNAGRDPEGPRRWFIDPLDGTTNYIHSFPMFAVSIALEVERRMAVGVTYGTLQDEMFTASHGGGAYLNGKPIHVSHITARDRTLLGTGFPFRSRRYLDIYLQSFRQFFNNSRGVRRAGAATLDLAYVAAGRLDGFWEMTLSPWDMAAGVVLVEEAGGRVTDFFGDRQYLDEGHIVASNGEFHDWMLEVLAGIFKKGTNYTLRD